MHLFNNLLYAHELKEQMIAIDFAPWIMKMLI